MRFQERLLLVFAREQSRRRSLGQQELTKTDIWKAAGLSSGAVSHWFSGSNDADLSSCTKIAPLLRCDPWWLFDESGPAPGSVIQSAVGPSDVMPKEIAAVVSLMHKMCQLQRGEVLGYARRVSEEAEKDAAKANAVG